MRFTTRWVAGSPPRKPRSGGPGLAHLGWVPGSRTPRRREGRGLWDHLFLGFLIGGLVWVVWWQVTSRDQPTPGEPAADSSVVRAEPADASPEPQVVAGETPATSAPPVAAPSVPGGKAPPDERSAPAASGDTIAARLEDSPLALARSLPIISAILLSEGRRLAVVDGRVLGAGQRVGSWELVSVDRDRVVLRDASGVEQAVTLNHE